MSRTTAIYKNLTSFPVTDLSEHAIATSVINRRNIPNIISSNERNAVKNAVVQSGLLHTALARYKTDFI